MELKSSKVTVRVTETLKRRVDEKLEQDGITMTDLLTACLMQYVGMTTNVDKIVEQITKDE